MCNWARKIRRVKMDISLWPFLTLTPPISLSFSHAHTNCKSPLSLPSSVHQIKACRGLRWTWPVGEVQDPSVWQSAVWKETNRQLRGQPKTRLLPFPLGWRSPKSSEDSQGRTWQRRSFVLSSSRKHTHAHEKAPAPPRPRSFLLPPLGIAGTHTLLLYHYATDAHRLSFCTLSPTKNFLNRYLPTTVDSFDRADTLWFNNFRNESKKKKKCCFYTNIITTLDHVEQNICLLILLPFV